MPTSALVSFYKAQSTTTQTDNGIARCTLTPTQPGVVSSCDASDKVKSRENFEALASNYGATIALITAWNT